MIVAVEGPDRCGKTTLVQYLRTRYQEAVFFPSASLPAEMRQYLPYVDEWTVRMLSAVYDPSRLFIFDRTPFVSGRVYDRLYGRKTVVNVIPWLKRVCVLYMKVPIDVLYARHAGDTDFDAENYVSVCGLFEEEIARYRHATIYNTDVCEYYINKWRYECY